MIPTRRHLILWRPDRVLEARLRAAAGTDYDVIVPSDLHHFESHVRHASLAPIIVLAGTGLVEVSVRAAIGDRWHAGVVLVVGDGAAHGALDGARYARSGLTEVVWMGSDDTDAGIRFRLQSASECLCLRVARSFFGELRSARALQLLPAVVLVAAEGGTVDALSRRFAVDRRTLTEWCEAAGAPQPRRLMAWTRLLFAASLLDEPWRPIGEVGRLCGYTTSALRTAFIQFVGRGPTELRALGALKLTEEAFRSEGRLRRNRTRGGKRVAEDLAAPPG